VLSVLALSFLVTSRLQRQTAVSDQNRLVARNYMDAGLHLAMRQVEDALTYPNYTDGHIVQGEYLTPTPQRLAPVGQWFASHYSETNQLSDQVAFQAPDALASPAYSNAPTINLCTPQVLRLLPSALTNGLSLSQQAAQPFRSGWIPLDLLPATASVDMQLNTKPGRIAFAVFNCSGFLDANTFASGPSAQKLPRRCFSQSDVTNWLSVARNQQKAAFTSIENALNLDDPNESPFFHLSYDTDPDVYTLDYDCFETCRYVGLNRFGAGPVVNLNLPQAYRVMGALKEQATYWKFNLNSVTNYIPLTSSPLDDVPWFNDPDFKRAWLDPVTELTRMMGHEEPDTTLYRLPGGAALPWSIANFMDEDRIPQISTFAADDAGNQELATRVNYAVEDVPLINKVSVFSIFDPERPGQENPDAPKDPDYYFDGDTSMLSNHYAVAVELWYPFAPNPPPGTLGAPDGIEDTACYVGIYTNAADVVTTTNRPWTQDMLRDWLRWNYGDTSNTVMQTLFYIWGARYTQAVGPGIWAHPLWQTINTDSALWFSTSMTNHVYWPVAETNGTYDITANPIWQAFYPETNVVVETNVYTEIITVGGVPVTNQVEVVSTNVYTTLVSTNTVLDWVVPPDTTNRMVTAFHGETLADYPWILWSGAGATTYSTNRMTGFDLADGTQSRLSESNLLTHFFVEGSALWVVVTNLTDGAVAFNSVSNLYLLDNTTNVLTVPSSEFVIYEEITRVQPLPMPPDLGRILDGLMGLLPTNSVSDLYTFLMATPDDLDFDWDLLFESLTQIPNIFERLFPSVGEPTLGNMTEADRHVLWPENRIPDTVKLDQDYEQKIEANQFQGYFWTVYPKKTVSFMEVVQEVPAEGGTITRPASTNYHALGVPNFADTSKRNTIWIRPVTTIRSWDGGGTPSADDLNERDKIVDEALLTHNNDNAVPVWGWTAATNLCVPEPRNNAFARDWRAFPDEKKWLDTEILNTTNLNTDVHELPFIHFNTPFTSIGDIGHTYVAYERDVSDPNALTVAQQLTYDTVTFSTRSGAALLDIFTLSPTNGPRRGLVQANTQHAPVIKALLADIHIGWTNSLSLIADNAAPGWSPLYNDPANVSRLAEVYTDALTNAPYNMGWRSYADMLPNLATNEILRQENVWNGNDLHSKHDYTEDVLRGLVDKVSFRQNIFVIVVAAQALSSASTEVRPIVLSDQRAAVTVIRDAYTGRWVIQDWIWLTE
jgi:hypothetical protein